MANRLDRIKINSCSGEELMGLPGVGVATAARILEAREAADLTPETFLLIPHIPRAELLVYAFDYQPSKPLHHNDRREVRSEGDEPSHTSLNLGPLKEARPQSSHAHNVHGAVGQPPQTRTSGAQPLLEEGRPGGTSAPQLPASPLEDRAKFLWGADYCRAPEYTWQQPMWSNGQVPQPSVPGTPLIRSPLASPFGLRSQPIPLDQLGHRVQDGVQGHASHVQGAQPAMSNQAPPPLSGGPQPQFTQAQGHASQVQGAQPAMSNQAPPPLSGDPQPQFTLAQGHASHVQGAQLAMSNQAPPPLSGGPQPQFTQAQYDEMYGAMFRMMQSMPFGGMGQPVPQYGNPTATLGGSCPPWAGNNQPCYPNAQAPQLSPQGPAEFRNGCQTPIYQHAGHQGGGQGGRVFYDPIDRAMPSASPGYMERPTQNRPPRVTRLASASASRYDNESRRPTHLPKTISFDGKGSWTAFYSKFQLYTERNNMSDSEKKYQLCLA